MKRSLTILLIVLIVLAIAGGAFTYLYLSKEGLRNIRTTSTYPSGPTTYVSSFPTETSTASLTLLKRDITASVTGSLIKYVEWRYYSKPFTTTQVSGLFKEKLAEEVTGTYSSANITNLSINLYPNSSVRIEFEVAGKVWLSDGEKYADFLWLLTPLGLDFIENHFNETDHGLYWAGTLNNVTTEVNVLLPKQATVYKAWGGAVGHCHGHIWWPAKP